MKTSICLLSAVVTGLLLKTWLVALDVVPFHADEAVVALMARHILQGERPLFFYGQAYMGSLDAWLVAGAFNLLGEAVWVIRAVQAALYAGVMLSTAWLGRLVFGSREHGVLAAWLLAIPAVNTTLYTTVSLGGYGEALLIGNLALITAVVLAGHLSWRGGRSPTKQSPKGSDLDLPGDCFAKERLAVTYLIGDRHQALWLLLGFLAGLGLWAFGLSLVFSMPAVGVAFFMLLKNGAWRRDFRTIAAALGLLALGGLLGSLPWWGFAYSHGFGGLVGELAGGAIAGVESLSFVQQIGQHSLNLLLGLTALLGMRPPWSVNWLGLPLLPLALAFWGVVGWVTTRKLLTGKLPAAQVLLAGVGAVLLLGFILTPFGADPSGRYFLPLVAPMALFAADFVLCLRPRLGQWVWCLPVLLLAFHLWGTVQSARAAPGITTQFNAVTQIDQRSLPELVRFLQQNGERRGYTNYWVAYPLAFISGEEIIFTPDLPYHQDFRYTSRDNRYALYRDLVADARQVAYITTHHPGLDEKLRGQFSELGLVWKEASIGEFHVFYALSAAVRATDLGYGVTVP